jgi:hypothetical protein
MIGRKLLGVIGGFLKNLPENSLFSAIGGKLWTNQKFKISAFMVHTEGIY